jgi:hypothetical protein
MDGRLFFALLFVVGLVDLIIGWRWSTLDPAALKPNPDGSPRSPDDARRAGRILMLTVPVFWILGAVVALGVVRINGIVPIHLSQG